MKFENVGLAEKECDFDTLRYACESLGLVHAGQWDYERVSFDYKYVDKVDDSVYYLRVQAYAIKGEIPKSNAVVKLLMPLLGKHYYPHGVEYEGETFPKHIVDNATKKLTQLNEKLEKALANH